jgi:hypothetical protein
VPAYSRVNHQFENNQSLATAKICFGAVMGTSHVLVKVTGVIDLGKLLKVILPCHKLQQKLHGKNPMPVELDTLWTQRY